MQTVLPLAALGRRIVIMGPSNAGKSTLALAIGKAIHAQAIHLDQFRHLPNTNWVVRPDDEFAKLHDAAIEGDDWVMEGNYSKLLPQRLARATGAIVLDSNRWFRLARYFRRSLFQRQRAGSLEGGSDSVKWAMVDWIMIRSVHGAERSRQKIAETTLPHVFCHTAAELDALYRHWGLTP